MCKTLRTNQNECSICIIYFSNLQLRTQTIIRNPIRNQIQRSHNPTKWNVVQI
jgi:hypothetical protein